MLEMLGNGEFFFSYLFFFLTSLARMDWVQTFPNFEDMPKGWLEEDLSAGLGDKHLFPNGKVFFLY